MDEVMRRKVVVSVVAALAFIVGVIAVGVAFGNGDLGTTGGLALVGLVVAFILSMAGIGVTLNQGPEEDTAE